MIKYYFEQKSQAWDEIRCGRITGTRFKLMMQADSTIGYKNLITELAAEIITGEKEESYSNDIMQRGIDLEPEARKEYEFIFGCDVDEVGFVTPDIDNKYHDWIGVSPDGLIIKGLAEFKCPLIKTHLNYIKADVLPNEYKYQCQGQLFVTRLDYLDFVSYYPKMKLFVKRIEPDLEMFEKFELELDKLIPKVKKEIEIYNNYNLLI